VSAAFPQLEIIELIGRGGMGFVFKARQPHLDRFVALKLLPDKLARDPRFAERFNREGRVLARLNHPNIVSVYDFGQTEHFYFLLMEFVDGVNLRQAMKAGRFSPGEALAVVPKICEALQYAHGQGILHRDIKPENILLDARGQVKIADFGIAKLVGEEKSDVTLTATGAALGTPHYMAPEQLEKPSEVDHRADIYSLGVVFYEMLTGELPIGRFAAPSSKTPVGPSVDEVVFRTLEKDRERRYQSAREMKVQVEHLTSSGSGPPPAGEAAPGPSESVPVGEQPRWSRKAIWSAVLSGGSLGVLPVMLAFLYVLARSGSHVMPAGLLGAFLLSLPALIGTLLGWMACSEFRAQRGRLRGLPLALFGALFWPLLLCGVSLLLIPWVLSNVSTTNTRMPLAAFLILLVPAGGLVFAVWVVYATVRWSSNKPLSHRRGLLKWVFIVTVLSGLGCVLMINSIRRRTIPPAADFVADAVSPSSLAGGGDATERNAWIRFTFTAVELRNEGETRWLAIDYLDDVHGDCQRVFRWDAKVRNVTGATRTSEFVAMHPGQPVRHQRVEFKLPNLLQSGQAQSFRDELAKSLIMQSFVLAPGEEKLLFNLSLAGPAPVGGLPPTLSAWIGVKPRNRRTAVQNNPVGRLQMLAVRDYQNLVLARVESLPRQPLHQIVARFAGPEIPDALTRARGLITGPLLAPAVEEAEDQTAEPVDGSVLWGTNSPPVASALSFECPGDYSLQFVLPNEELARDAARQIQEALASPLVLLPDQLVPLFTAANWKGWLEVRPFQPQRERLTFFRHPGHAPAQVPGTNLSETAVVTLPVNHQLELTGRLAVNGVAQSEPVFAGMLYNNGGSEPAVYWFTWYTLPNPQSVDGTAKMSGVFQVHDPLGNELLRGQTPLNLPVAWQRRWPDEPKQTRAGTSISQMLFFEQSTAPSARGPTFLLLEMVMQSSPQVELAPSP
jgi:tRNA A-37 threonylcarbamoyl transferase component Bud32